MTNIQKWFMIIALWTGIMFMVVVFYWMAVRPARVRKMCAEKARTVSEQSKTGLSSMMEINRAVYSDCLRLNGVDK
jgi:hypothetical protein